MKADYVTGRAREALAVAEGKTSSLEGHKRRWQRVREYLVHWKSERGAGSWRGHYWPSHVVAELDETDCLPQLLLSHSNPDTQSHLFT